MFVFPQSDQQRIRRSSRCSRFLQNESRRVQFEQLVNACFQYALSLRAAIERGCSIGANFAQNCQLTTWDLEMRRVAIARFRIIRARFNKRSMPAFPTVD